MSNFTSRSPDEWNKSDLFKLWLFSPIRPLDQGFEALEPLLEVVESLSDELRPDRIHHTRRVRKYSRRTLHQRLHESYIGTNTVIRVEVLGGRWVPRKKLEEAAVIIGDRAWLPFLRARHALQNQEAPLDYSCSQLFRTAERLASAQPPEKT